MFVKGVVGRLEVLEGFGWRVRVRVDCGVYIVVLVKGVKLIID